MSRPSVFCSQTYDELDVSEVFVEHAKFPAASSLTANPQRRSGTVVLWPGLHRHIKVMAVVGITAVQVALRKHKDIDIGVGDVNGWGGEIALFYSNWMMAAVSTT